jgi:hypothetical protein
MFDCSFDLNEPLTTFKIGTATFAAFSGYGAYINKCASTCLANFGPIPTGSYYIIDRQSGGRFGWLWDRVRGHADWFAYMRSMAESTPDLLRSDIARQLPPAP